MIFLYLLLLGLAVVVYICTPRMRSLSRLVTAVFVFLIPAVATTAAVIIVGDRIPPDAVTVDNELNEGDQ